MGYKWLGIKELRTSRPAGPLLWGVGKNFFLKYSRQSVDVYSSEQDNLLWRKMMLTLYTIFGMFVGFEGYDNGKVYIGVYTPQTEYGYVLTQNEIYLDTVLDK